MHIAINRISRKFKWLIYCNRNGEKAHNMIELNMRKKKKGTKEYLPNSRSSLFKLYIKKYSQSSLVEVYEKNIFG